MARDGSSISSDVNVPTLVGGDETKVLALSYRESGQYAGTDVGEESLRENEPSAHSRTQPETPPLN
jgi:hypothetical protein